MDHSGRVDSLQKWLQLTILREPERDEIEHPIFEHLQLMGILESGHLHRTVADAHRQPGLFVEGCEKRGLLRGLQRSARRRLADDDERNLVE